MLFRLCACNLEPRSLGAFGLRICSFDCASNCFLSLEPATFPEPVMSRPPSISQPLRQLFFAIVCLGMAAPALAQSGPPSQVSGRMSELENASGLAMRQQSGPDAEAPQKNAPALQKAAGPQSEPAGTPPHRRRWNAFRGKVISVQFVSGSVLGGTAAHLVGSPDAIGRDAKGYLARVGTITGSRLVAAGVRHGASAMLGLKLKSPEPQGPLGARLKQAAVQELATRTTSGRRVPAVAETAGIYGAILTRGRLYHGQWRPGKAATGAAVAIGFKVAWAAGSELIKSL
jgi:hypothetical protein